ncbi:hypothetical protein MRQ47_004460 [Salmonella enterica]|nr:hypothetical protein [Salmonella enterica]
MAEQITVIIKKRRAIKDYSENNQLLSLSNSPALATVTTVTHCQQSKTTSEYKRRQNNIINEAARQLSQLVGKGRQKDHLRTTQITGLDLPNVNHPGAPVSSRREAQRVIDFIREQVRNPTQCHFDRIASRWPHLFSPYKQRKAITREAFKEIKHFCNMHQLKETAHELALWMGSRAYLNAVIKPGAVAYNLDGTTSPINSSDRDRAEWQLIALRVIEAQHRANTEEGNSLSAYFRERAAQHQQQRQEWEDQEVLRLNPKLAAQQQAEREAEQVAEAIAEALALELAGNETQH